MAFKNERIWKTGLIGLRNGLVAIWLLFSVGCAANLGNAVCRSCDSQDVWQQAIDEIAKSNFPQAEFSGEIYKDNFLNSWSTDEKKVFITSRLLDDLQRMGYPYLLSVSAHEMAHIRAEHYTKKGKAAYMNFFVSLITNPFKASFMDNPEMASLSRKMEFEADRLAVEYMRRAGYAREDYLNFLEWIRDHLEEPQPSALSTHPTIQSRIDFVSSL